tara:strand:+ start:27109 stop:28077 length:969 start_codon:yes stop_codon:yes gene_type:complete
LQKTAIITGVTGQDGSYLSKLLLNKGYKVIGITRESSTIPCLNHQFLKIEEKIDIRKLDLLKLNDVISLLEEIKPDEVYNLAAQSSVGLSFDEPIMTLEFNIFSTINLLEAIRKTNKDIRMYQASSSEMFGQISEEKLPLKESTIFHPVSPYAISKASSHWTAVNYRESYGLFVSCGILFNHESVLRRSNFVSKKILSTAIKISKGEADHINLGNLDVFRDWGYAPDYVEAMWLMLQHNSPDDFLICSGEANSLKDFVHITFESLGLDPEEFIRIDQSLLRPVDLKIIYGTNHKAREVLGWEYDRSFKELVDKLLEEEKSIS